MRLIQDLGKINDIVNVLSLHATKSDESLHRQIYELIGRYIDIAIPKNQSTTGYLTSILNDWDEVDHEEKKILTEQLIAISTNLRSNEDVVDCFRRLNRVYDEQYNHSPDKDILNCHMYIAMLNHLVSHRVTSLQDDVVLKKLYGYGSAKSNYFVPTNILISTNLSTIMEVQLVDDVASRAMRSHVAKISINEYMDRELEVYGLLEELGADLPEIYTDYKFLGCPVLVMEMLSPLKISSKRLPLITRSLIEQLRLLHMIGIHCDIKPSNIMQSQDGTKVYLIDYGGMILWDDKNLTRSTYTPAFASQRSTSKTPSITNDLIELIYTLNYLRNPTTYHHDLPEPYMSMIRLITTHTNNSDIYDKLISLSQ